MSSITLELQANAMDDNVSIQTLLRKAYAIAIKLSVEDSKQCGTNGVRSCLLPLSKNKTRLNAAATIPPLSLPKQTMDNFQQQQTGRLLQVESPTGRKNCN